MLFGYNVSQRSRIGAGMNRSARFFFTQMFGTVPVDRNMLHYVSFDDGTRLSPFLIIPHDSVSNVRFCAWVPVNLMANGIILP